MRALRFVLLAAFASSVSCGGGGSGDPPTTSSASSLTLAGRRYVLKAPAGYGSEALPLVVAIHGYGVTPEYIEGYFGLDALADARGFFVAYPEGTMDPAGRRFFSATDACCDFYGSGVDDVAFIAALLDHLEATYPIDSARVFVVGHSNGGFMAYRLACDLSSRIAAIVSLSGAMWSDPSRCRPTAQVGILEVHGTDDGTILPQGGSVVDSYPDRVYPSVLTTVTSWVALDHCKEVATSGQDPGPVDSETTKPADVVEWCDDARVGVWMIQGGTHIPALTAQWPIAIYDFLTAHPKSI